MAKIIFTFCLISATLRRLPSKVPRVDRTCMGTLYCIFYFRIIAKIRLISGLSAAVSVLVYQCVRNNFVHSMIFFFRSFFDTVRYLHVYRRSAVDATGAGDWAENALYANEVVEKHPSSFDWYRCVLPVGFNVPVCLLRRGNFMVFLLFLFLHAT